MELGRNKKKTVDFDHKVLQTSSGEESFINSKLVLIFPLSVAVETTFWRLCRRLRIDSEYDLGFYPRF